MSVSFFENSLNEEYGPYWKFQLDPSLIRELDDIKKPVNSHNYPFRYASSGKHIDSVLVNRIICDLKDSRTRGDYYSPLSEFELLLTASRGPDWKSQLNPSIAKELDEIKNPADPRNYPFRDEAAGTLIHSKLVNKIINNFFLSSESQKKIQRVQGDEQKLYEAANSEFDPDIFRESPWCMLMTALFVSSMVMAAGFLFDQQRN